MLTHLSILEGAHHSKKRPELFLAGRNASGATARNIGVSAPCEAFVGHGAPLRPSDEQASFSKAGERLCPAAIDVLTKPGSTLNAVTPVPANASRRARSSVHRTISSLAMP